MKSEEGNLDLARAAAEIERGYRIARKVACICDGQRDELRREAFFESYGNEEFADQAGNVSIPNTPELEDLLKEMAGAFRVALRAIGEPTADTIDPWGLVMRTVEEIEDQSQDRYSADSLGYWIEEREERYKDAAMRLRALHTIAARTGAYLPTVTPSPPPLPPQQQKVLEILQGLAPGASITSKQIAAEMERGTTANAIRSRLVPGLRKAGIKVKNARPGYYIEP